MTINNYVVSRTSLNSKNIVQHISNSYFSVFKQINVISGSLSDGWLQLHFINRYHSKNCRKRVKNDKFDAWTIFDFQPGIGLFLLANFIFVGMHWPKAWPFFFTSNEQERFISLSPLKGQVWKMFRLQALLMKKYPFHWPF